MCIDHEGMRIYPSPDKYNQFLNFSSALSWIFSWARSTGIMHTKLVETGVCMEEKEELGKQWRAGANPDWRRSRDYGGCLYLKWARRGSREKGEGGVFELDFPSRGRGW